MRITCLGTGSPESHAKRASSGYLVEIGDAKILLDCGGGVVSRLIEQGTKPSQITHLFFTHLHSDHMMDYGRLIHAAWDEEGAPIQVFGPPPIADITQKLFGRDGVFATDLTARTEFPGSQEIWQARGGTIPRAWPDPLVTEIYAGFSISDAGWRLTSCVAPHAQPYLECMAFRLEAGGRRFVYSVDAGLCAEIEALCENADLLIHWCYRLSQETKYKTVMKFSPNAGEIAAMAQRTGVKKLRLTHIRAHMDKEEYHQQMQKEASAVFSGDFGIAEDLQCHDL